jgi:hypothetical protein
LIKTGETFELSHVLGRDMPLNPGRQYDVLTKRTTGPFGTNQPPRVISVPTFSMPSLVKPLRVAISRVLRQVTWECYAARSNPSQGPAGDIPVAESPVLNFQPFDRASSRWTMRRLIRCTCRLVW